MSHPLIIPIVLQIVGIAIIAAEVLIPSGGILTLLATAILSYSLYAVFTTTTVATGWVFVGVDLVVIPLVLIVGFRFLAKSPVTLRTQLSSDGGVRAQNAHLKSYIGRQGFAITPLRPSGIAVFDKERLDVVTEGSFLDQGTAVEIIAVTGNQIIVRQFKPKGEAL
jgi:membrane-bound ClpP family serine protease